MVKQHKSQNFGKIVRLSRSGTCIALASAVLFAVGCANDPITADPMKGEIHPQRPTPYGSTPPSPTTPPAKTSGTSWDPLLGGASQNVALAPIPNSRPQLAIPADGNNNVVAGFTRSPGYGPTVAPLPTDAGGAGRNSAAFGPSSTTTDILQAQLRSRGVVWQKQEALPDGGVKFSCVVPNRYNPESCKIYEATARDMVSAIQATLVQIDRP